VKQYLTKCEGCLLNKRTARTEQHDGRAIRRMPRSCWNRRATVPRRVINISLHITRQYTLSAFFFNQTTLIFSVLLRNSLFLK